MGTAIIPRQADYVTVVENRPIMSAKYRLLVLLFHFWSKLTHPGARSLCDSWATCLPYISGKRQTDRQTNKRMDRGISPRTVDQHTFAGKMIFWTSEWMNEWIRFKWRCHKKICYRGTVQKLSSEMALSVFYNVRSRRNFGRWSFDLIT